MAADDCSHRFPGRLRRPDPEPRSPELAARLVPSAELAHLGIFVVDFAVRLFLAEERLWYVIRHWYDVLVIVLPLLRPLRLLRLIPLLSLTLSSRTKVQQIATTADVRTRSEQDDATWWLRDVRWAITPRELC
jgi:hypothetical protein